MNRTIALFALALLPLLLNACCASCGGYGYVRASGRGCPADPQACVIRCLECNATGSFIGIGPKQDKDDAKAEMDKLHVLCID